MKGTIHPLTGLRFIAAMMVLVSHYPVPGTPSPLLRLMQSGYAGVTFFFVLSGFILTYNYADRFLSDTRGNLVPYLVSRFARIYPVYLLTNLFMWFMDKEGGPLWVYLLALQPWSSSMSVAFGLNDPSWSIGVEVFLYAAFPFLILGMDRLAIFQSRWKITVAGCVVVFLMLALATVFVVAGLSTLEWQDPYSAHRWLYRTPLTRILDFALGILAAAYISGRVGTSSGGAAWTWAGWLAIGTSIGLMAIPSHLYSAFSYDVSYAVPCAILIVALTIRPRQFLSRALGHPVLVSLGEASYSLYLVHIPARPILIDIRTWLREGLGTALWVDLISYSLFILILIALSYALYYGLERPARAFIRSLVTTPVRVAS